MPMLTPYPIFDSDTHLLETPDAWTRHIESRFKDHTMRRLSGPDGKQIPLACERLVGGMPKKGGGGPGRLAAWLKQGLADDEEQVALGRKDPAYFEREPRLKMMDEQGVEACLMFPGGGLHTGEYLRDPDLLYASLASYNRWLEETWGFAHQERIFATPLVSLDDVDRAVALLDWAIERGARAIVMRPGPIDVRSPADPHFDPFWARMNEAGVVSAYHITFAGPDFHAIRSKQWGQPEFTGFYEQTAWQWVFCYGEQTIMETIAALILENLFGRFHGLRVVTSELGCEWGPPLAVRMDKMRGLARHGRWLGGELKERPSAVFKRHVRMHGYPQDDVASVVGQLGPDVVLASSDFPHSEGLAEPTQFGEKVAGLPSDQQRKVLRDNGFALMGLA